MKKRRGTRIFSFLLTLSILANGMMVQANDTKKLEDGSLIKELKFSTDNSSESKDQEFKETIKEGGKTYRLAGVSYETLDKTPVKIEKEVVKEIKSDPLPDGTAYEPAQTLEEDGIIYTLDHVKDDPETTEPYSQNVTGYTDYDHAVTKASVPATKRITVKNNRTGENTTVTCQLQNVSPVANTTWENTHIDIVFESYDSNVFRWNGITVSKNTSTPLKGYENQLLQSVGADTENYRVGKTYWTGDAYRDGSGVLCRNARADVQRNVQYYRANYSGSIQQAGEKIYTAVYKGTETLESSTDYVYTMKAVATYELQNNTIYIVAAIGIFLLFLFIVLLLFLLSKKKKTEQGE